MITRLAGADHQTDWGMRIISQQSKAYDGSGYHYGAVWPLFTGWAAVGEYRYHRPFPAYANLRSNALLATDGSLGHFSEVLSGDYYQSFATSSPHQIWSAAMVISPILRGMFGLDVDTEKHEITLSPHVPADWTSFAIHKVQVGDASVDFKYRKTSDTLVLDAKRTGSGDCWIVFSPALSLRTEVASVEMDGRRLPFKMEPNANDQHVNIRFPLTSGSSTIVIHLKNDFGLALSTSLPQPGSTSQNLRILSESWNGSRTELTLNASGLSGKRYELSVWNAGQISSVEGAELTKDSKLRVQIPTTAADAYSTQTVSLHFRR
jgi:hypothetical protein